MISGVTFYDVEVFKHGWSIVFKNQRGQYKTFISKHTDVSVGLKVKEWLTRNNIWLCGFNSKHYDDHILHAITLGFSNEEIKELNDFIINDRQQAWLWYKFPKGEYKCFDSFDSRDDLMLSLSLKAIEGNLGMKILESSVPFDIDRPLTDKEWEENIEYNKFDVDATERVFMERQDYLQTKIMLGEMSGIDERNALSMTNAKLVAAYLVGRYAKPLTWSDETVYSRPQNIEVVNDEVNDFFSEVDPEYKSYRNVLIGDIEHRIAWGGLHGALPNFHMTLDDDSIIINADGLQFYPSMMNEYEFLSRAVKSPELFEQSCNDRVYYKSIGDTAKQKPLKLVNNTTYGASKNQYNALYDPRMANSVCITGQLLLIDLIEKLEMKIKSFKLIQSNTDGIMFKYSKKDNDAVYEVFDEWQKRTRITLEYDLIKSVHQKDVNNYMVEMDNGKIKTKGGYLATYGGRTLENGSLVIVSKAIVDYFIKGISPEVTINQCNDPLDFQMIAKAGGTYDQVMWESHNGMVEVNRVNRVYASKDHKDGTLYKIKHEAMRKDKIASLPERCLIDNNNEVTIDQIDKEFYINMATKRIHDFIGKGESELGKELQQIVKRKTYKKLDDEVRVFNKGDIISDEWNEAQDITKKKYDDFIAKGEEEDIVVSKTEVQGIVSKIFEIRKILSRVQWEKDGTNTNQEYNYITEAQYKKHFESAIEQVGLDFVFNPIETNFVQNITSKQHLTEVKVEAKLIDTDTNEERLYYAFGQGADMGDKGIYKALTGALKYFISTNFLINDNNDPEADEPLPKPKKTAYVAPSKRDEIKEEIMETEELATAENKRIIKDLRDQLKETGEHNDLVKEINSIMKSKPTNNVAIELIMRLEDEIDEI
ncbi:hypothetical protein G7059_08055 [Erysipelothrix sp. HDW6A]|uniref:ERF family protein n=1 Tax=Erysipelothrix sp. HDW6A TaxID=2714928 RepID=UPI00140B15AC|nr:ERF family protein [Erysipelothrix sp. HDW6A]QIK57795.1 hypothetical protein G7059_08055 [Erysipelothrix sp. HDW6A]